MHRIFITGGTGFFGKSILNYRLRHPDFLADADINPSTGRKSKIKTYRICDNHTRFYLKYIEGHFTRKYVPS